MEPMLEILDRVQPDNEPPFEARMQAVRDERFLLIPGVYVQVKYHAAGRDHMVLDEENLAILGRNPQLIKKA